jgi:L-threonylcarbamoyladenylate synthase
MTVVEGEPSAVAETINRLATSGMKSGYRTGIIATDETKDLYDADFVVSIGARDDEDEIARHLYGTLRWFDEQNVDVIYSESFDTPRIGGAIMNRLLKAAGHNVIQAGDKGE